MTVAQVAALAAAVPSSRTLNINGTSYDLSANRSWTVTGTPDANIKRFVIQNM